MKRKFIFAFMVVLLCSMPIYLTGQSTYPNPINQKIGICVEAMIVDKDQHVLNLIKGYFLQSLRQIPDVILVDKDNGTYTIRLMAIEATPGLYTIAYALTSRSDIAFLELFVRPEAKDVANHFFKDTCTFLSMGIFHASPQTLEQQCKNVIVGFDGQFLQELRNSNQRIMKFPKNGNP